MSDHVKNALKSFKVGGETVLRAKHFPTGTGVFIQRQKDRMKRRDKARARKLIQPENADQIIESFPISDNEVLHAITPGDFVLGDLLDRVVLKHGFPLRLDIATLSLSAKNVAMLARFLGESPELRITLLISHYFKNTNKEIFQALDTMILSVFSADRVSLKIARSHAKVILFDYPARFAWTIETSANLRSSNNVEQMTVFQSREVLAFHRRWMETLLNHRDE